MAWRETERKAWKAWTSAKAASDQGLVARPLSLFVEATKLAPTVVYLDAAEFAVNLNRSLDRLAPYAIAATLAVALLTAAYPWLPLARPLYLFAVALCLPGVVLLGRSNPLDKILGDLSYPVYLIHPLFMIVILPTKQIVPVALSIALAYLLIVLLEKPLDLYRQSRVSPHPAE